MACLDIARLLIIIFFGNVHVLIALVKSLWILLLISFLRNIYSTSFLTYILCLRLEHILKVSASDVDFGIDFFLHYFQIFTLESFMFSFSKLVLNTHALDSNLLFLSILINIYLQTFEFFIRCKVCSTKT